MLEIKDFQTEYRLNPVGIDEKSPRFSWKLVSDTENTNQTSYRLKVSLHEGRKSILVWDTKKVSSSDSIHINYAGNALLPETKYYVNLEVTDNHGEKAAAKGTFITGFLGDHSLISAEWLAPEAGDVVPVFSKTFELDYSGKVPAYIFLSAYGIYEAKLNGKLISDALLAPGLTVYSDRLQYQMYDVSSLLRNGKNTVEILISKGWCCGRYPFGRNCDQEFFVKNRAILCQLDVFTPERKIVIKTDNTWECRESKLRFAEIYDGEIYDNSFDSIVPVNYHIADYGYSNLIGQISEPVRAVVKLEPVELITTPLGEKVIDFGQNLSGFVEFDVHLKKGEKIKISHAEVLDKDGNFYTRNLRSARELIQYTAGGKKNEKFHSKLTFQGFRYIRLDEYPCEVELSDFRAYAICTDMSRTGHFSSSHKLLNQLYSNVIWGNMDNFVDIPTDCPQRDERAGWTGDIQVFSKTAVQNFNAALFFKKWLGDVRVEQGESGSCPVVVPGFGIKSTACGWGDAATVVPMECYMAYGDKELLEVQYEAMRKWVEYLRSTGDNEYLWNTGKHYGDWLTLDQITDTGYNFMLATAYYAYSAGLVSKAAGILGKEEDRIKYSELAQKVKEAFAKEYLEGGLPKYKTQTAHAIALHFGLAGDAEKTGSELLRLVRENSNKLKTGFLGTPYLCDALFESSNTEAAFDILLQEEYPSWLYSVKNGATTTWEHWDSRMPDGSFWSDGMNSFNHYAYGSIADFMYKKIAGIEPIEPGYKKILIRPVTDKRIDYAEGSIDTVYGIVSSSWRKENSKFVLEVEIPANTTAKIVLPDGRTEEKGSGKYCFEAKL